MPASAIASRHAAAMARSFLSVSLGVYIRAWRRSSLWRCLPAANVTVNANRLPLTAPTPIPAPR